MKLDELMKRMQAETIQPGPDIAIQTAYTSDLLSDVMAHAESNSLLITIQAHTNTIAVAFNADIRAVLICHNRPVPDDMKQAAAREHIGIYRTNDNQYVSSWKVYTLLQG
ncbi:MAG: hypothetical protein EOM20_03665 [Spartobacteria bacterium]|nr:hypothetical protein [Spartobacteria bacterium]